MKKLTITILLTILIPNIVYAQDISVEDLLGSQDEEISQNVEELEEERTEEIENELNISIPEYTDNPSHIITFVDPSEEEEGVELDVDESGYQDINSPYSLPSLNIGNHHLKFRFIDSVGATKVLEYDIVIIPRPPVIKAPEFSENNLLLSGTGLANSEVVLTVSVGANNYTQIADIDSDGNWNTSISMDNVTQGIYTIWGYTRKDGYASNPSEPSVMEYGQDGAQDIEDTTKANINFDLSTVTLQDIPGIVIQNPDLVIVLASVLLLGALISSLIFILVRNLRNKETEQEFSKKINGKEKKEEKTLKELFGEDDEKDKSKKREKKEKTEEKRKNKKKEKKNPHEKKDKEKTEKKEGLFDKLLGKKDNKENKKDSKKKAKKKEKVFTKQDFLKDFKDFDPDSDSGKEKKEPTKKEKKDVIVTLTSKKKEE
jgi:hypothetical protein